MHILLGLLGLLGGLGVFLWRLNQARHAARELADVAGEVANLPRKMRFQSKARRQGIDVIEDPKEAAAALAYGAISCGRDVSSDQKAELADKLAALFEIPLENAKEVVARGAWHIGSLNDPINGVNKLTDLLINQVGPEPVQALADLIEQSIDAGEPAAQEQAYFLDKLRRRAGLI